jgi:pimeloyl-ACP methyl ester carboxylesterase
MCGTQDILSVDRFVPHVSTVPAILGQTVGLHLRERIAAETQASLGAKKPEVVLCIHGGYAPSVVAYDLDYKDYSVMKKLAAAGYDVFAMTHTGYGASPKPMMDDPCNVDAEFQHLLIPHVLKEQAPPRYPFKLVSSQTEFDEIESVVRYIMDLRGVDKIHLFGWSTGVPRAGGFAAMRPELVEKLVLVAPAPFFPTDDAPDPMPEPGAPTILQTRDFLMQKRWMADVRCEGQIEDAEIRDVFWNALIALDTHGKEWGAEGLGIMRAPNRMNFGWRANTPKIKAPTLTFLGEFDNYQNRCDAWKALTAEKRVFIKVECASHFVQFERGRHVLLQRTVEWLRHASIDGTSLGEFTASPDGTLHEGT